MTALNPLTGPSADITNVIEFLESTGQLTRALTALPHGRVPTAGDGTTSQVRDVPTLRQNEYSAFGGPVPESIEGYLSDNGWDDLFGSGDDDGSGDEETEGFDFAAVYWPIHFHAENWGIGVRTDSACRLAIRIAIEDGKWSRANRPSREQRMDYLRAATEIYVLHETWHHRVEAAGIRLHLDPVLGGSPVYRDYSSNVYQKTWGTDDCREEALANAFAIRELGRSLKRQSLAHIVSAALRVARKKVQAAPPGYRRGLDFTSASRWDQGRNDLLNSLVRGTVTGYAPSLGLDITKGVDSALTRDLHRVSSPHNVMKTIRWIERGLWI